MMAAKAPVTSPPNAHRQIRAIATKYGGALQNWQPNRSGWILTATARPGGDSSMAARHDRGRPSSCGGRLHVWWCGHRKAAAATRLGAVARGQLATPSLEFDVGRGAEQPAERSPVLKPARAYNYTVFAAGSGLDSEV
jgi:hypothetical protein